MFSGDRFCNSEISSIIEKWKEGENAHISFSEWYSRKIIHIDMDAFLRPLKKETTLV